MLKRTLLILLGLVIVLAGCSPAKMVESIYPMEAPAADAAESRQFTAGAPMPAATQMASTTNVMPDGSTVVERLVIQNADLTIVVDDPASAMDAISALAKELTGFVVTSRSYKTRTSDGIELPQANITIRVPAASLDDALTRIKGLTRNPAEDVRNENRSGEDVTAAYTDLQSRLKNLEETEAQLREIMASATKTEDVMSVFNQLTYIREQIEVLKGQIKYYEESAALSAITVQILAQEAVAPLSIGGWKPVGVARDALQALINALKFLANLLIWVVIFLLPIALLVGLPIYLIVRGVRRRKPTPPVAKE